MKWILLVGDEMLTLDSIKSIEHYGSSSNNDVDDEQYCVMYSNTDYIIYDGGDIDSTDDYDEDALKKIPFKKPHIITMKYRSGERVRKILMQDNFLRAIYVDNDLGLVETIEKFIELGMPMEE